MSEDYSYNDENDNNLKSETCEALRLQNPARILRNIYLSAIEPAQNLTLLEDLHISHILNLTGYKKNSNELRFKFDYPCQFTILHIKISDEIDMNICDYFDQSFSFIENSLKENNSNRILIHCEAGISRSATIVIAYLMKYHHQSLKTAYEFVKQRKKNIDPNIGFFKQLITFEKQLNNDKNFQTTFPLNDYLLQYMLNGPAAGFTPEQILDALRKTNNNTDAACNLLFSIK